MKRLLFFVLVFSICYLSFDKIISTRGQTAKETELAQTIRQFTNRSTRGLTEEKLKDGGYLIDLKGRFQNVSLIKKDSHGSDVEVGCVTGIEEANAFFGKNLETGELLQSLPKPPKNDAPNEAARHGMSSKEFEFYKSLIEEEAARRRLMSPNSATITIVNSDGAGEGFNDATSATPEGGNTGTTLGQQRLNLFNFAAGIWGTFLDSNVTISVNSQFNSLACSSSSAVLGSAGTTSASRDFTNAPHTGTFYHIALANKLFGSDRNGATAEINATFNSNIDTGCFSGGRFYYGLDNSTPAGTINLLVVLLHEIGHGLGFSSLVTGSTGALLGGFPDTYTRLMFDRSVNLYWHEMTDAQRVTSSTNAGNVFWDGPSVKIASSTLTAGRDSATGRVQLYTPSTFQSGSSISHWDTSATPNLLMEPSINTGLSIDLDLTRQQMRDIGWHRDTTGDLVADTITSVTPSGNAVGIGTTTNITWTNTGGFNRNVTIELSTNGGTTYSTIASNVANTGSYSFTVPNTPTSQGRIRVREFNFAVPSGVSAANFTILSPTSAGADITGHLKLNDGTPLKSALVSLVNVSNDSRLIVRTNDDGFYKFSDVPVGASYIVRPLSNRYSFAPENQFFVHTSYKSGVDFTATRTTYRTRNDFDGDGRPDIAVFRPSEGNWYLLESGKNIMRVVNFGLAGDTLVPDDYDGDGKTDIAVWRSSARMWFVLESSTNRVRYEAWGLSDDLPAHGDYDNDGKADLCVWRPNVGTWFIKNSSNGMLRAQQWGLNGDLPVANDYDGDGKLDLAVFRKSEGNWYIRESSGDNVRIEKFGLPTDVPVQNDYDGDGRTDLAVYRAGIWYLLGSASGFSANVFGLLGDDCVANDYDKDGKADLAVFRAGTWFILGSQNSNLRVESFGMSGDIAVR